MTRRIFFPQNKAEITSTVTSDTDKVPSCAAVSTALAGKLGVGSRASGINIDNKNDDESVPSVKAVTAYVDSKISGAMDFTVAKDTSNSENPTISVTNDTSGLCAVRVTKMSDGSVQYKSKLNALGDLSNQKTAFKFDITESANYMIEAWHYNSSTKKLVPTAVNYI